MIRDQRRMELMGQRDVRRGLWPLSLFGAGAVTVFLATDQGTKLIVKTWLPMDVAIDILPILALQRVHNTGIAFSFLANTGPVPLFIILVAAATLIFLWSRMHRGGQVMTLGFAMVLGGIFGNLIDRLRLGYVVDFLMLHIGQRVFFVFNVADVLLIGGLLVLVYAVRSKRRT